MNSSAFLSYSSHDQNVAETLVNSLRKLDVSVWFDKDNIRGGEFYAREIPPAIRKANFFLLLSSRYSTGDLSDSNLKGSHDVEREFKIAVDAGVKIIPLAIDAVIMNNGCADSFSYFLSTIQTIDLRVALRTGQYDSVCQQIMGIFHDEKQSITRDGKGFLTEVETLLKAGNWFAALDAIPASGLDQRNINYARLLTIIAHLQSKPLRELVKPEADGFVRQLNMLLNGEELPAVYYLLGVLSQYFYDAKAMHDITGGLAALKISARAVDNRLSAKYLKMIRPMLPDGFNFELRWQQLH